MKTAMQELKSIIELMINNGGDSDLLAVVSHIDNWGIKKEKEQIISARKEYNRRITAEEWYNQTYNQNK